MLNMQTFYKLLSTATENKDAYLEALSAITRINPGQLSVMDSNLDWSEWAPSISEPATA